ncbi:MAG: hypothetical protein HC923_00875 [Myxococcales bacterium]|nr:hypothetical protein [Myxococcales bacterium]
MQFEELQRGGTLDPFVAERTGRKLAFTWQRKGDLRYNINNYINQVQGGPWGIAQFGQDPETGEFVSNTANYFADAGDLISQRSVDYLQWRNGDLSDQDLIDGEFVRDIVFSRRQENGFGILADIKDALSGGGKATNHKAAVGNDAGAAGRAGLSDRGEDLRSSLTDAEKYASMFAGTDLEREHLVTDTILRAFAGPSLYQPLSRDAVPPSGGLPAWAFNGGMQPGGLAGLPARIPESAYVEASPLNWAFVDEYNPYEHAATVLGGAAIDMADFFDPNVDGLAAEVKGQDRDTIFKFLQEQLYEAVQGHEVGHAVGLRHNFEGSMDPQNYRPEFWNQFYEQIQDGVPTEENSVRSQEYKYASIMDYGFDFTINGWHGLGSYDKAAIRFFYGQLVEAWDPAKVSLPDPRRYGAYTVHCGVGDNTVPSLKFFTDPRSLPQIFGSAPASPACASTAGLDYDADQSCDTPLDTLYRDFAEIVENVAATNGMQFVCGSGVAAWNPIFEALEGDNSELTVPSNPQNLYEARMLVTAESMINQERAVLANQPERDDLATADENEFTNNLDDDGDGVADDKGFDWGSYVQEVEYAYCTDIFAGFSNPFCQRWDAGWDFEEQVQNHILKYDRDFIFDHFRRDRDGAWSNPGAFLGRLLSRRFKPMSDVFQYFLFTRETTFASTRFDDWRESAVKGLNFLERVLTSPEVGTYCLGADNKYRLRETLEPGAPCSEPYELNSVGYGGGAYIGDKWNDEYYFNTTVLGNFWDKLGAIFLLTRSSGFFQFDLSAIFDRRAFSLPYIRVFRDPLFQRFSAVNPWRPYGGTEPRLVTERDANGDPVLDANGEPVRFVEPVPFLAGGVSSGSSARGREHSPGLDRGRHQRCAGEPGDRAVVVVHAAAVCAGLFAVELGEQRGLCGRLPWLVKVAIRGLPGDIDWTDTQVEEFVDPETLVEYVAPCIQPFREPTFLPLIPEAYYGDRSSRARGNFHEWSVACEMVQDLNEFKDTVYMPRRDACVASAGDIDPTMATTPECTSWEHSRGELADRVGFLNLLRKFSERAEGILRLSPREASLAGRLPLLPPPRPPTAARTHRLVCKTACIQNPPTVTRAHRR